MELPKGGGLAKYTQKHWRTHISLVLHGKSISWADNEEAMKSKIVSSALIQEHTATALSQIHLNPLLGSSVRSVSPTLPASPP